MKWAALLAFAACSKDRAPPPKPPPPPPKLEVLRCGDAPKPFDPHEGIGTIGTGRYGVIGHGAGTGHATHHEAASSIKDGEITVHGSLDKTIVHRYLRRHRPSISYCYERALLDKPDLRGDLQAKLTISANGNVVAASASFVEPSVGPCAADALKQIEFPKAPGGGAVEVEATFTLESNPNAPRGGAMSSLVGSPPEQAAFVSADSLLPKAIEQWTPFAAGPLYPSDADQGTADAAKTALDMKQADLERCFADSKATGSLRAMIDIAADGSAKIRTGGLGDAVVEACVTTMLRGVHFALSGQPRELACDLVRGEPAPWRVVSSRYTTIRARKGGVTIVPEAMPGSAGEQVLAKDRVALVSIDTDATPAVISDALTTAAPAPATLVVVHDELVGVAPAPPASTSFVVELRVKDGVVTACRLGQPLEGSAPVAETTVLREAISRWRNTCGPQECHLRIAGDSASPAELVGIATAARNGGVQILAIAPEHGCGS